MQQTEHDDVAGGTDTKRFLRMWLLCVDEKLMVVIDISEFLKFFGAVPLEASGASSGKEAPLVIPELVLTDVTRPDSVVCNAVATACQASQGVAYVSVI